VSSEDSKALMVPIELGCGVVVGPLFVSSFTAIGARREDTTGGVTRSVPSRMAAGAASRSHRRGSGEADRLPCHL
jgi:hypothetical protein